MSNTNQSTPNLNTHLNFGNFDPSDLQVEETVNVVLLIDTSGSMSRYSKELNEQITQFITWMQGFHQAPKLYLSIGEFDSDIRVLTGFQQVNNVSIPNFDPRGGSTRLYDGSLEFLKNQLNQQERSLQSGILSKSIFFVITDGEDNASASNAAQDVKSIVQHVQQNESMMGTFASFMVGIGDRQTFENAQQEMGIQKLFVIDPNLDDKDNKAKFKEAFGILSASVKSASTKKGALVI